MKKNHNYGWFIHDYSVFFEKRNVHFDQLYLRLSCQQLLLTLIQSALLSTV